MANQPPLANSGLSAGSDPERLIQDNIAQQYWLGHLLGFEDPGEMYTQVQQDKAIAGYVNPLMYSSQGLDKAILLLKGLDQCQELALGLEESAGTADHLSLTLRHLRVHLALLVGEYEKKLKPFAG